MSFVIYVSFKYKKAIGVGRKSKCVIKDKKKIENCNRKGYNCTQNEYNEKIQQFISNTFQ
jgi:hypothetical protein